MIRNNRLPALAAAALIVAACEAPNPTANTEPEVTAALAPTTASVVAPGDLAYYALWNAGGQELEREILPLMRPRPGGGFYTAPQYYSYNTPYGASANTPDGLEESQVAQFFLFDDGQDLSLFMIWDRPNDADGGSADVSILGLPNGSSWIVRDDPGDASYVVDQFGNSYPRFQWVACCTDGGAIRLANRESFSIGISFSARTGLNQFKFRHQTENGDIATFSIPAASANSLRIEARTRNVPPIAVASAPALVELNGGPTATVQLDGSGSSDPDGGPNPLVYSWSQGGPPFSTDVNPTVDLGIGTHTILLTIHDGVDVVTDVVVVEVVDPTPPAITAHVTGTEGDNGWYVSAADIDWTVIDLESSVSLGDCSMVTATDGTTTETCTATSAGGETVEAVTVRVDTGAPVITFSGNLGSYGLTDVVAITCSATDAVSGIATSDCPAASGEAWTFGLGTTTLDASATDVAGNSASASTSFEVAGSADGICDLIESWVSNRGVANALCTKLRAADRANARGNSRAAAGSIGAFVNQVEAVTGKWLTEAQAQLLLSLF